MRSGIRLVNLIVISSLLSGCETAADAFFSAGDRLFQPGSHQLRQCQPCPSLILWRPIP